MSTPISTPNSDNHPSTPLDSLPTPTSASEGRNEAASLLRDSIQKMQLNDEKDDHDVSYEELKKQKDNAEANAALLSAELVALRGRHEEEKRQLKKVANDLRRRNEELERSLTLQRSDAGGVAKTPNGSGRSASCSQIRAEEEGEGRKIGSRLSALAQRWKSPHPRDGESLASGEEEEEEREVIMPHPINVDFGGTHSADESTKIISALEEKLRQSEHRATVLEQRLTIVKESGDAVIQSLNEELADVAEDRARVEAAMIKELSLLDSQRRTERNEYEKRIQEWIVHDANRKIEVEDYETRIEQLLGTVRMMGTDVTEVETNSSSWDKEAEQDMFNDLVKYIELLKTGGKGKRSLVMNINDEFDLRFNANPNVADDMLDYYRSRPELKEFTLKSELPRMDYQILIVDKETGKDVKLSSTDEIRSYFASLEEEDSEDDEVNIILRAANQSLLADPLAMLTSAEGDMLVHSGSFHSTVISTACSFKLDLRREGERRVKVQCELAICVPSGKDGPTSEHSEGEEKDDKASSATLELARANLVIQFSPSPTSTPSGPLVKYSLMDIKPTITDYDDEALQSAAAVLARDRNTHIQCGGGKDLEDVDTETRPNVKDRFFSRVKQFSMHSTK